MLTPDLENRNNEPRKDFPFLLLKSDFFNKMFNSLIKNYGSAGKAMIFGMGKDLGTEQVKELVDNNQWFDKPHSEVSTLEQILLKLSHMGWGKFNVENYDPYKKKIQLTVRSTPFIDKSATDGGGYTFLQGVMIGITSEIFEKEMSLSDLSTIGYRYTFSLS